MKKTLTWIVIIGVGLLIMSALSEDEDNATSASFSAKPTSGVVPVEVNFDASNSSGSDGSISSYNWDFGDGSTSSKETVTHTYNSAGNYTVELIVTDSEDTTDSTSQTIEVYPLPSDLPTASFTAYPTSGKAPLEVSFDASGSSDPDGTIDSYSWDFIPYMNYGTGSGVSVSYTFDSAGTYGVELTVTDNDGATDSTRKTITVESSPGKIDYRVGEKEILVEFEQDWAKAKEKYSGTTVAITGEIDGIFKPLDQRPKNTIYFEVDRQEDDIYLKFPDSRKDEIRTDDIDFYEKKVTIVCEFDSYDQYYSTIHLDNCYIE